ncbi:MAG: Cu(I)/Ag(I) efflux system membrane fusion protein, partial [Flavobacteriales bacterium]
QFLKISDSFIDMTDSFNPNADTLYLQFCPMANSNKGGYWLSQEKEVKNPYFGLNMLKCGTIEKIY